MQVALSSGGFRIISNGVVFLYDESNELTIRVSDIEGANVCVSLQFFQDNSNEHRIEQQIFEDKLLLKCFNFKHDGTGLSRPAQIATVNGKKIYLTFWSYQEGSKEQKSRSVKYTLFCEP